MILLSDSAHSSKLLLPKSPTQSITSFPIENRSPRQAENITHHQSPPPNHQSPSYLSSIPTANGAGYQPSRLRNLAMAQCAEAPPLSKRSPRRPQDHREFGARVFSQSRGPRPAPRDGRAANVWWHGVTGLCRPVKRRVGMWSGDRGVGRTGQLGWLCDPVVFGYIIRCALDTLESCRWVVHAAWGSICRCWSVMLV